MRSTSASLTPATGVGTTRFCRTQQRCSSCADQSLTARRQSLRPPCNASRAQRHRVHRIPHSTYRDDAYAPLHEAGWREDEADLGKMRSDIFLPCNLDDPNRVEMAGEIRFCAQGISAPRSHPKRLPIVRWAKQSTDRRRHSSRRIGTWSASKPANNVSGGDHTSADHSRIMCLRPSRRLRFIHRLC